MPKNEDGEFELILGNNQLLSMFFVVVVLLGVFFVMGYLVGRSSTPQTTADAAHKSDIKPLVVDSPAPKPAPAPEAEPSRSAAPTSTATQIPDKQTPEKPVEKALDPVKAAPPAPAQTAKVEPLKSDAAKATKARPISPGNAPVAGATYLQLSATSKPDADAYVEVLRKNGFAALDAEVPEKPGTFRVLVGPVPTGDLNKTREDLKSKGIPATSAIPKKY